MYKMFVAKQRKILAIAVSLFLTVACFLLSLHTHSKHERNLHGQSDCSICTSWSLLQQKIFVAHTLPLKVCWLLLGTIGIAATFNPNLAFYLSHNSRAPPTF